MEKFKGNVYLKILLIVIITLLLLIPAAMIQGLIKEREYRQQDAIREVSSKWGEEQTLTGPVISIPYYRYVKQYSKEDSTEKVIRIKEFMHFLPDELDISGNITPEKRNRGIYDIVVYNSRIDFKGVFNKINTRDFDIPESNILFEKATVSIGIPDLRGIEKQISLNWNDKAINFNPGTVSNDIFSSGINAQVPITREKNTSYRFSFSLDLKGSQLLYFVPVGKVTNVKISSPWPNPKFDGSFLPDDREVTAEGFIAHWNVLHLNRNFPQMFTGSDRSILQSSFGVNLLLPVDNYQKSMRSAKYAILFVALTFLVFIFVELLNRIFLHPIQYILVGLALIVFFTLLLAISEHIPFNGAYLISAVATLALVSGYVRAILRSSRLTILISGMLSILYAFIFVIIQLQDYALLIGSIGIFIILSLVMYYSRKIDWYNITRNVETAENEEKTKE